MVRNNRDEKNTYVLVAPFTLKHTCNFVRHIKLSTESCLIPILPLVKLRAFCRHYLFWEITLWNWYYDVPIDLWERGSLILIHIGRGAPQITVSYCVAAIERVNAFSCAWWYAPFMVCVCVCLCVRTLWLEPMRAWRNVHECRHSNRRIHVRLPHRVFRRHLWDRYSRRFLRHQLLYNILS